MNAPASPSAVVVERRIECTSDICAMWERVTDTDRLNRSSGMLPLDLSPLHDGTASRYVASTVLGGFSVDFEEAPFEWTEFEKFVSVRKMRSGPTLELRTSFEFSRRTDGGTGITVRTAIVPRFSILRPLLSLVGARVLGNIARTIEAMDKETDAPRVAAREVRHVAIERAEKALEGSDREIVALLVAHVSGEDDADLTRMRPYALADTWGKDRTLVLTTCLEAVPAGLLELRWDVICPSCRTAADRVGSLQELPSEGHCHLCELTFDMDLDRAVEATFTPHSSIREVGTRPYCIGGPARTPHVYTQAVVPEGGLARLAVPKEAGKYKLFVRGGATTVVEVLDDGPSEIVVVTGETVTPERVRVAKDGAVVVENHGTGDRHVKLERLEWLRAAASAHDVSLIGTYRRQFSADVLKPGTVLRVGRVGLLFTDLTASTALYSSVGDASAFKVVSDHFDLLREIIERHHGTVVKTIGDAVMAAFADELDGIDASADILAAFHEFRQGRKFCDDVFLKLGFHAGPSFIVNANQVLDYFGQTVNIAARLQATANASELVTDLAFVSRAEKSGRLGKLALVGTFDATLKGLSAPIACGRLALASGGL